MASWTRNYNQTATIPSYSVGAGTNRLLVVGLAWEDSAESNNNITLTYGGQSLTRVVEAYYAVSTKTSGVAWYVLDEAGIAAASSSSFSVGYANKPDTLHSYLAVYTGIDQTTPVSDSDSLSKRLLAGGVPESISVTRAQGGFSLGIANASSDGDVLTWGTGYTAPFATTNYWLSSRVATKDIYTTGTETLSVSYPYESHLFAMAGIMLNPAAVQTTAEGEVSGEAVLSDSYASFATKEESAISGGATAGEFFSPVQEGPDNQYVPVYPIKNQILYAAQMNRIADNIRLVRTSETGSGPPINKEYGAFWLDSAAVGSLQMKITALGDQMVTMFAIDPVNHTPDFSVAMGGDQFEEYSLGTSKIGSGQLTNADFADGAFTKDKIYQRSQYRFGANAIGSGTLAQNAVDKTKVSSGALRAHNWALDSASVSGYSSNVTITLNKFSLMPDFRASSTNMRLAGHNTTSNPDAPKIRLDGNGSSYSYDVSWYYIDDA